MDERVYTSTKARSLTRMKTLVTKGYCSCAKHLGCVRQPLFDIPLDRIVPDELHLLLRIGDVLLRNLILQVDSMGPGGRSMMDRIPMASGSWKRPSVHVVSAFRSGRTENQLASPSLVAMISLLCQGSSSSR